MSSQPPFTFAHSSRLRRSLLQGLASWPLAPKAALATPPRTLVVGPGALYGDLAGAVAAARDGDRIDVLPGTYRGQVAVLDKALHVRGLGTGAVFEAAGHDARGKGILVVQADVTVENLTLSGARVPDGNGAGIRFDRGRLRVERCVFRDNEMGLLGSFDPDAELIVHDSVFAAAPRHPGQLHHLMYAGTMARLELQGCRFEGGWRGHLLKSRARRNDIVGNLFRDGPEGGASYELELTNGGHNTVVGNVIVQSPGTQNGSIVAVGYNARRDDTHSLAFVHNTVVNLGAPGARFVRLWMANMPAGTGLNFSHNLFVGPGDRSLPVAGCGNLAVPLAALPGIAQDDFRPLQPHGVLHQPCPQTPLPSRMFRHPVGTQSRPVAHQGPVFAGAVQR